MTYAAQYLRMSTEHQQYSLANQAAAIESYASIRNFTITHTYADPAKSGVTLRRREGLKRLLEEVVSGQARFSVILVYDISRWGRFQDADEAAHYEFLCKSAGIPVEYCAEPFANDSSISSTLFKALKRSMAAEYSRELAVKVKAGHVRLARLGFKQGGMPGLGLRRLLVPSDPSREARILVFGERKGLTDRVILAPGPEEEVVIIRRVFDLFTEHKMSIRGIASILKNQASPICATRRWDHQAVKRILTANKYAGDHVYGKRTIPFGSHTRFLPPEQWTIARDAFTAIVSREQFELAQQRLRGFTINKTNDEILEDVKAIWKNQGRLSKEVIERSPHCASLSTVMSRFGSLTKLYERLGYDRSKKYYDPEERKLRLAIRERFIRVACERFPGRFVLKNRGGNFAPRLCLTSPPVELSLLVARYSATVSGRAQWICSPNVREKHLPAILLILNRKNDDYRRIYLFRKGFEQKTMEFRDKDIRLKAGFQVLRLDDLLNAMLDVVAGR